ncbi:putative NADH-Ubiquinone/plastoquinone [Rhodopirellula islandica]|uniref:NADH-Ubiquinone/plastoquinone n=1 Tax=Rhodopirellula islandica TaxID=595434 RepID=A0A0J1BF51_RHOIS|nr:putative NADH-Ubiquinone/plastoquinone [Rhodopirellula islandica]
MTNDNPVEPQSAVEASGAWPFVSRRVRLIEGTRQVWNSRQHRKGTVPRALSRVAGIFSAEHLNAWIGTVFAIGAACFVVASCGSLFPWMVEGSVVGEHLNAIYFAGSIPFTTAAGLQLFQAASASARLAPLGRDRLIGFGWYPRDIGWLSCALQFVGTVLFNFNTLDAMSPSLNWLQQDLVVWAPDWVGSVLFLASGYLAFIETCHAHWAFQPRSLTWWIVWINLLGCVGFMISACFAFVLPSGLSERAITVSTAWTLQGAVCFLIGALLTLFESPDSAKEPQETATELV